jgi:hypothetical protein
MDVIALFQGGERASANYRMITSYWDTAASLVLNGGIDEKMFLDANTDGTPDWVDQTARVMGNVWNREVIRPHLRRYCQRQGCRVVRMTWAWKY